MFTKSFKEVINMAKKKSLINFIKSENSLEKILDKYIEYLSSQETMQDIQHASALAEYRNIRFDEDLSRQLNFLTLEVYNYICQKYSGKKCEIQSRIKSLVNTEEKILRNISLNLSMDIKDYVGIRIIMFDPNTNEGILNMYKSIIAVIEYLLSKGFILCSADNTVGTKQEINKKIFPGIIIPKEEELENIEGYLKYKYCFKDYILTPKADTGYQSLHVVVKAPTGNLIEFQFRNFFMHQCSFKHSDYKESKYNGVRIKITPNQIHTQNFVVNEENEILDYDGIVKSLTKMVLNNF